TLLESFDHVAEDLPGVPFQLQIRPFVVRRRPLVDDCQAAPREQRLLRQRRDRVHLERGADDEQQPGPPRQLEGLFDGTGRQELPEEDDVRFQYGPATVARRRVRALELRDDVVPRVGRAAPRAPGTPDRAVYLDDVATPRTLVEEIDVLRHDGVDEAGLLEPR